MEVINKPNFSVLHQSVAFLRTDKRKWVCLGLVVLVPLVYNSWRFIPADIEIPYYDNIIVFWWSFSVNFICLLIAIGWMLTIPRKDYVMKIIVSAFLVYGIYMTYVTLPFANVTPVYIDIIAIVGSYIILYSCIVYVQKHYLEKKQSYESLHINLLHGLNHHRFMGAVCRIEGMVNVSNMEDHYREACEKEIDELKETFAYIIEKYESLN